VQILVLSEGHALSALGRGEGLHGSGLDRLECFAVVGGFEEGLVHLLLVSALDLGVS